MSFILQKSWLLNDRIFRICCAPPSTRRPQDAHRSCYSQFAVNTRKMSVSLSQPDNKALKDKQKWWHKRSRDWELLRHHPPFLASGLQSPMSRRLPVFSVLDVSLSAAALETRRLGKACRKHWIMIQKFLSLLLVYGQNCKFPSRRCVCVFPACLWHIYSWHRDSPQAACNGKVLRCQKSHSKLSITVWPWTQQDNER